MYHCWLQMKATPFNIFQSIQNDDKVRDSSNMITIDLFEEEGTPVTVNDTEAPIAMVIPRDPGLSVSEAMNITANMPNTRYAWTRGCLRSKNS